MVQGGSVSVGREGGLRKGTSYEGNELGMDGARERGEGRSERRREGATGRGRCTWRSVRGREIGKKEHFKGCTLMRTLANIHYTLHKTTHNADLALDNVVLQMKNNEQV